MAMQQLTTADLQSDAGQMFRLALGRAGSARSTDVGRQSEHPSFLNVVPSARTEEQQHAEGARSFHIAPAQASAPVVHTELNRLVIGTISSYDDASVKCDIALGDKVVTIQLPRAIFPDVISYGLPISLEMIEDSGIRRPLVSVRKVAPESVEEIADRFDYILNAL
jgi:hypothetical protein